RRVDKMVPADGYRVPVAHHHDHLHPGLGELHPRGKGEGPAVRGAEGVEIDVDGQPAGAADARDQHDLVLVEAGPVDGADKGPEHDADSAARTPHMGELLVVAEVLMDELGNLRHQDTSMRGFRISSGVIMVPSSLLIPMTRALPWFTRFTS